MNEARTNNTMISIPYDVFAELMDCKVTIRNLRALATSDMIYVDKIVKQLLGVDIVGDKANAGSN